MENHNRGRSPSTSQPPHIRLAHSASPHPPLDPTFTADTSLGQNDFDGLNLQGASASFADPSFTQDFSQQAKWSLGPTYTEFTQQEQIPQLPMLQSRNSDFANSAFHQLQSVQANYNQSVPGSNHVSPGSLSQNTSPVNTESSAFPSFDFNQTSFDQNNGSLDPALLDNFDPSTIDLLPSQQQLNDLGGNLLDPMATIQSHSPTPPHLLPEMAHRHSTSPSPHASPNFTQGGFQNMGRPRATSESLDPASALYVQGQGNEWSNMGAYRGHRRTPSDNYSEISSHSNQNSPYMPHLDSFEHSSPLLNPTQDPTFGGNVDLQNFNLNENQMASQNNFISPGHSPQPSPRLAAQQTLPRFTADNNYGLNLSMNGQFNQQQNGGLDMFPGAGQEPFPSMNQSSPGEFGAADQLSPPEISIDFAPTARNPVENARPGADGDALSPPSRAASRNRMRAKSDSYAGSRPTSPGISGRGRSPSLQPQSSVGSDTLAPLTHHPPSRSPSPARGRNGSQGTRAARSSSNASDQRDYVLTLANPERTHSNGPDSNNKRIQKHPATFECNLCPKRFTRAYNLRSHLRTHTDERPFVCTVCGKAFARQHDRKRHEGLHSGEKKFVCRGMLQSSPNGWGCGRRFARADALGRHFRSEAGRVCIKPLLDEEAAERQRVWMEEQTQLMPQQPPQQMDMLMDGGNNFLPAALLQQYPALAGIDWSAVPAGGPEDDLSGRSSFDAASSGGEYYDDISGDEVYGQNPLIGGGVQHPQQQQPVVGGYGVYGGGNQAGDYLSDFEGR